MRFVLEEKSPEPDSASKTFARKKRRLCLAQGSGILDIWGQEFAIASHPGRPSVQRCDGQVTGSFGEVVTGRKIGRGLLSAIRTPVEPRLDAERRVASDAVEAGQVAHADVVSRNGVGVPIRVGILVVGGPIRTIQSRFKPA